MKIIRYRGLEDKVQFGIERGDGSYVRAVGDSMTGISPTNDAAQIRRLFAPVVPPIIWCIGLHYRMQAAETGLKVPDYPVVFAKPATSIQHPNAPIALPSNGYSRQVDYECELVIIIGRDCKNVPRERTDVGRSTVQSRVGS